MLLAPRAGIACQRGDAASIGGEALVGLYLRDQVSEHPIDGVGVVAEDQHFASVAHVVWADALGGGFSSDVGQFFDQSSQVGIIVANDNAGLGGKRSQQSSISVYILPQTLDVVEGGVIGQPDDAAEEGVELFFVHLVGVGGDPLGKGIAGGHPTVVEQ